MSKFIDLTGERFGRLVVIEQVENDKHGNRRWLCKCNCGREKIIRGSHLRQGYTQSCGCLSKEKTIISNKLRIKHGHCVDQPSKKYEVWHGIIGRCINPNHQCYNDYGGRGITVCKRWLKFENFDEDMPGWKSGLQIDRIDNDKGYCEENCRWATRKQQARNRRSNHLESYNGEIKTLTEWAEEYRIDRRTLLGRIKRGQTIEEALTTPVRQKGGK